MYIGFYTLYSVLKQPLEQIIELISSLPALLFLLSRPRPFLPLLLYAVSIYRYRYRRPGLAISPL